MQTVDEYKNLLDIVNIKENLIISQLEDLIIENPGQAPFSIYTALITANSRNKYLGEYPEIENVIEDFLYRKEFDSNGNLFSLAMRLLFTTPNYFNNLSNEKWTILVKLLMNAAKKLDQIYSIYSIKCLQIGYLLIKNQNRPQIQGIEELAEILVNQLKIFSDIESNEKSAGILVPEPIDSISMEFHKLDVYLSKDRFEYGVVKFDIFEIYQTQEISILCKRFHYMVLLKLIIPEINGSQLVESKTFLEFLYASININRCKLEIIACLAASIINDCISDQRFSLAFLKSDGIRKICSTPYSLASCKYVCCILAKISNDKTIMTNIFKFYTELVQPLINYVMSSMQMRSTDEHMIFFMSSKTLVRFFDFFTRFEGILNLIEELTELKGYKLKSIYGNETIENRNLLKSYKPVILPAIDKLITYFLLHILSHRPSQYQRFKIFSSNDPIYCSSLNYFNEIENDGGLKGNIPVFDEVLTKDFIEFMMVLCVHYTQYGIAERQDTWNKFYFLYHIFALYHKSNSMFITSFHNDILDDDLKKTIIWKFKCLLTEDLYDHEQPSLNNLKIFLCLLLSCFDSKEQYLDFKNKDETSIFFDYNHNFKKISEAYLKLDLIYYFMIISTVDQKYYSLAVRGCCVKILYFLSFNEKACQIMSEFTNYFNKDIPNLLFKNLTLHSHTPDLETLTEYSSRLVLRICKLHRKCFRFPIHCSSQSQLCQKKSNWLQKILKTLLLKIWPIWNSGAIEIKKEELDMRQMLKYMKKIHPDSTICQIESFLKSYCEDSNAAIFSNLSQNHSENLNVCSCRQIINYIPKIFKSSGYSKLKIKECCLNKNFNKHETIRRVYHKTEITSYNFAKFLNDGNVAVTLKRGFRVYSPNFCSFGLYFCPVEILFLTNSHNCEYIASSGKTEANISSSWIWKYNSLNMNKEVSPVVQLSDSAGPIFSHSDKYIYSVSGNRNVQMFGVERGSKIMKFSESNTDSFYFVNSIDTNNNDTLLSFNGDIFCTRSGKLIHQFERFNIMKSGKFMPSDIELLIDSQLWDLRTLRLIRNIDKFSSVVVNTTGCEDILYGIKYTQQYDILNFRVDHFDHWADNDIYWPKYISFYSSKHFTTFGKINVSKDEPLSVDVSRDSRTFISLFSSHFKISEIGISYNEDLKTQPLSSDARSKNDDYNLIDELSSHTIEILN